jgi:ribosomal-protein-alanine N-acetyltransferase
MYELLRLRSDHEDAVLNFEVENRAFFSRSISDRGDEFFEEYALRHRELLAEQGAGIGAFYVLVDDDETVVGRFNLYEIADGSADVGYRIAERVSSRGVATSALRDFCRIASRDYELRTLRATTTIENVASQRVLGKSGFIVVGSAQVAGRDGLKYEFDLTDF